MNDLTELKIMTIANGLVSEDGENPEYDRAIVEFACELIGLSTDDFPLMMTLITGRDYVVVHDEDQVTFGSANDREPEEPEVEHPAYLVACPYCDAPKYLQCRDMRPGREGVTIMSPHTQRIREAQRRAPAGTQHR